LEEKGVEACPRAEEGGTSKTDTKRKPGVFFSLKWLSKRVGVEELRGMSCPAYFKGERKRGGYWESRLSKAELMGLGGAYSLAMRNALTGREAWPLG